MLRRIRLTINLLNTTCCYFVLVVILQIKEEFDACNPLRVKGLAKLIIVPDMLFNVQFLTVLFFCQIRSTVNEVVGVELSQKLYPILLTQIMRVVNSFFTTSGQVNK